MVVNPKEYWPKTLAWVALILVSLLILGLDDLPEWAKVLLAVAVIIECVLLGRWILRLLERPTKRHRD